MLDPTAPTTPVIAVTGDTLKGQVVVVAHKVACPIITAAEFKVDGAVFHGQDGLDYNPNTYEAQLHWDDTFTGAMPLLADRYVCACAAGTHGGGTYTSHVPFVGDCQGTLSFENADAPKDAWMKVLSVNGSGTSRSWTIQLKASSYGVPSAADCSPPPPFGRYHPDTLWQGTITLPASGSSNTKTATYPISSDPSHAGYESWTGSVTFTGVW